MTLQQEVTKPNRKKLKKLSLKVWKYLMKNPEIYSKPDLPYELYEQIAKMSGECPLCEIFVVELNKYCEQECEEEDTCKENCEYEECTGCPLSEAMDDTLDEDCGDFYRWNDADTDDNKERKRNASIIVKKIKKWKV